METRLRTVVKSLTWRICGLLVTVATAWIITRNVEIAASIGAVDTAVKIVAYYLHERMWLKIRFGRLSRADYEI
ncbi:MAG: DUF2061 domain-containing protein [Planctomycetes bacterium]|nr:DUF2061 domain-containing protein [Planctomycetota bacterium]